MKLSFFNSQINKKTKNTYSVLEWILGGMFWIMLVNTILNKNLLLALILFIIAIVIFPLSNNILIKYGISLSKGTRLAIAIAGILIIRFLVPVIV